MREFIYDSWIRTHEIYEFDKNFVVSNISTSSHSRLLVKIILQKYFLNQFFLLDTLEPLNYYFRELLNLKWAVDFKMKFD